MFSTDRQTFISSIDNIGNVPPQNITQVHKNRISSGLVFHTEGENEFIFEDHTVNVLPNTLLYLPEGSSYRVHKTDCFSIAINFKMKNFPSKDFAYTPKNTIKMKDLFVRTELIWRTQPIGFYSKCMSNIYSILADIENDTQATYMSSARTEKLRPAIEYIHENYATARISIEYLAQITDMSATYFRKTFKQLYGVSPVTYINHLKIQRAKEALRSRLYTVEQVAYLAGYSDPSFFRREFKHYTDMTPTEYIEKHQ
ncbi:MAG: hypothetical protein DBY29_07515 [Coprobacillus sp.]|nr:MAG: hypothetical protein DBY29_07515 [Coprobacillus sp.]